MFPKVKPKNCQVGNTSVALVCSSNKRPPAKAKKSPVGNWLSFFHLGKSQSVSKRKLKRHPSEPNEIKSIALPGEPPLPPPPKTPHGSLFFGWILWILLSVGRTDRSGSERNTTLF